MAIRTAARSLIEADDDTLVAAAQSGDDAAFDVLLNRYRRFARAKGRGYFVMGGDADDIEQEALIGLYKAIRDFSPTHGVAFRAFAEVCITRQVISAVKTATRQKHQPLNSYVSLSGSTRPDDDETGGARAVEHLTADRQADPIEHVLNAERAVSVRDLVNDRLSDLEVEVLALYVEGRSYAEISTLVDRHTKAIDNAIQRIKRKLGDSLVAPALAVA